jgi:hypothetical protein
VARLLLARPLAADRMDEALAALDTWRDDPAACVWYSLPFAEGRKPDAGRG